MTFILFVNLIFHEDLSMEEITERWLWSSSLTFGVVTVYLKEDTVTREPMAITKSPSLTSDHTTLAREDSAPDSAPGLPFGSHRGHMCSDSADFVVATNL